MKAQFIHVEDYSKKGYGKTTGKYRTEVKQSTISGVCHEANRLKAYCKHVPAPQPPKLLYGVGLNEVQQLTEDYYNNTKAKLKNGKTRALRSDSDALLAGVVSVPQDFKNWDEYKQDTIAFLKQKYGHKLKSVIEHVDEPNPHLHFYVVQDPGLEFALVHDGKKAIIESNEKDKKKHVSIYKKAMQKFNDDFYNAVSSKYNLSRKSEIGRARIRGTTEEYKQAIKQLEQLKLKNKNLEKRILKAKEQGFKAGLKEFEQKNIITKFNVLNINKKELEKELEYNKTRKELYKSKYKKTKESLSYVKEQQKKDAELAIKYRKKIDEQKELLELKEKQKIEKELENEKLKKKNNYLNNMLNAVQKFFKKQWFEFSENYYKEKSEFEQQQKKTEVTELTPTPTYSKKLKI